MVCLRNDKEMEVAGMSGRGRVWREPVPQTHGWLRMVQTLPWGSPLPVCCLLTGVGQEGMFPGKSPNNCEVEVDRFLPGFVGAFRPPQSTLASPPPSLRLQSCLSMCQASAVCAGCLSSPLPVCPRPLPPGEVFSPSNLLDLLGTL